MKKYAKFKLFMVILLLKLVVCFLITDNIVSTVNHFAGDASIFSAVNDANSFADEINNDLQKISEWVYRWKKSFNPRKLNNLNHPKIYFNNAPVFFANWQKHLGIYLDESLNFRYHYKEKCLKQ